MRNYQLSCIFFMALYAFTACQNFSIKDDSKSSPVFKSQEIINSTGVFDGIVINKYGYAINEYYIALSDINTEQADSLKGKKIKVTGLLYLHDANDGKNIQSANEIVKYIRNPQFEIIHNK
ncbi:MAG: hypothetical protein IAE67_08700 [Candidatus Competibacteraceae bacterium]|nr:hypothetical protein [Candidatus Competibacteraceae bacterium]